MSRVTANVELIAMTNGLNERISRSDWRESDRADRSEIQLSHCVLRPRRTHKQEAHRREGGNQSDNIAL